MQKFLVFSAVGLEIGFLIYAAYWIGGVLDERYHSNGLIFVILAFAMLIAWMIQVIWLARRFQKEDESSPEQQ